MSNFNHYPMQADFSSPDFKPTDRTKKPLRDLDPKPLVLARTKFIKPPKLPEINEDQLSGVQKIYYDPFTGCKIDRAIPQNDDPYKSLLKTQSLSTVKYTDNRTIVAHYQQIGTPKCYLKNQVMPPIFIDSNVTTCYNKFYDPIGNIKQQKIAKEQVKIERQKWTIQQKLIKKQKDPNPTMWNNLPNNTFKRLQSAKSSIFTMRSQN